MFQNIPLPAAQEVRHSSSGVTPCIIMRNDGVLYHQVSSFSPERWTKVVLQERAVVGSVYSLPWRYSVVQCYSIIVLRHNEYHLHSIVEGALSLDEENRDASIHLIGVSSLVRMGESEFRPY